MQMNNILAEQQVNNNKARTKTTIMQEHLSSPQSQVLKTYDFGNFENCKLKVNLSDLSLTSYPHLYHKHSDLHEMIWLNIDPPCALCTLCTKAFVPTHC